MSILGIISLVLGLVGIAAGAGVSIAQSQSNERSVSQTNETNLQAVRETNASNVEQAELSYKRSLPINQVNNMMATGMSKTAAIQSLSGGGTYQAPVLQSAHADAPQKDLSGVASALERLGNIPSNAEQFNLQQMQRRNLDQEYELRQNEERRKQEMHNALIDEKNYSKWERESMDSFMSLMENTAQEKNIQPSPNQSMHEYVRALGLQDNEMYKKLPVSARQRAFDKYKQIQDEKRAQRESDDKHTLASLEASIKESNLRQMAEDYRNSVKEHNTQDKERLVREGRAVLEKILIDNNINQEEFLRSFHFDSDGHPNMFNQTKVYFKEAWSIIGSILPIDYLGDILRGLIKVG